VELTATTEYKTNPMNKPTLNFMKGISLGF